jgi:hypothetical protein
MKQLQKWLRWLPGGLKSPIIRQLLAQDAWQFIIYGPILFGFNPKL